MERDIASTRWRYSAAMVCTPQIVVGKGGTVCPQHIDTG